MSIVNPGPSLRPDDIATIESHLGLGFPEAVRTMYLRSNGGKPKPYVFENDRVDTVVSEFLPLKPSGPGSAQYSYDLLVKTRKLVPTHFFPLAVDGGGDYFFVDCKSPEGRVYLYRGDSARNPLVDLSLGFAEFWTTLKAE